MATAELDRKATRQFELRRRGLKQLEIAKRAGVSEATVSRVLAGTTRHEGVEAAIAEATGLPRDVLFPSVAA